MLLAKLSAGDMVALDAVYHTSCLETLHKRAASVRAKATNHEVPNDSVCHGLALAELIYFMEESQDDSEGNPVFKLRDLSKLYAERLEQMGVEVSQRIHSTRLKERILKQCPDLQSYKDGREIMLAFNKHVGAVLRKASEPRYDDNAMILSRAAKVICQELLKMEKSQFDGTFSSNCQENSVPPSLRSLIEMIMGGTGIRAESCNGNAALSISQLIRYNSIVRRRKDSSQAAYHSKSRETPLPVYIGLLLHAETRKKGLVDKLSDLGLSIPYGRVLEVSTELGNMVGARFEAEKQFVLQISK